MTETQRNYTLSYMVAAFLFMYIFQGLFFGYLESISLLLKEKGFSFSQMSLLKFTTLPFYTKCFFSPVLDIFYSRKMGKRMTYIFSFSLISACCYFFISLFIDGWIADKKISVLSFSLKNNQTENEIRRLSMYFEHTFSYNLFQNILRQP